MLRRTLGVILVNVIVFCVLAELLALFLFYNDTGRLFYTYQKPYEPIAETKQSRLTGDGLHPYFGPTHRQGYPFDIPEALRENASSPARVPTNNFGFASTHKYPFVKTSPNQFVIGMFGGSVGAWFCQVGAHRMVEDLKANAFFKTREIVPLCLSHEGYKQPQQLIVLAYFLTLGQQFNLVINIDGFNEVALGSRNNEHGRDISMPSPIHIDPLLNLIDQATLTPARVQALARISVDKERLNGLIDRMRRNRSAAVHVALDRYYRFTMNRYQAEVGAYDALPSNPSASSLLLLTPPVRKREGPGVVFGDIANDWTRASLLMHDLLAARGVPYLHVLQPNQYFTRRTFSDAEARVALNKDTPFKRSVENGYPALERAAAMLAEKEQFVDGTTALDREPGPVYEDDCCHYTDRGYEVLADLIAERVGTN